MKKNEDDDDALIEYAGLMSNAIDKPVENKTCERAKASKTRTNKSELIEVRFYIAEFKELVKMGLSPPCRHWERKFSNGFAHSTDKNA